jgi:hypothetical protein
MSAVADVEGGGAVVDVVVDGAAVLEDCDRPAGTALCRLESEQPTTSTPAVTQSMARITIRGPSTGES